MQTDAFHVFDTTLRDGAQREGITYSVADKLAVARLLDQVGVGFEHFFDGYKHDPDYGVRVLGAAAEAGADVGVLCDTNGGMLPMGVYRVVAEVRDQSGLRLGIHCQDDTACAVANTLAAVEAGASHVQC